jgi:hypothetical protein
LVCPGGGAVGLPWPGVCWSVGVVGSVVGVMVVVGVTVGAVVGAVVGTVGVTWGVVSTAGVPVVAVVGSPGVDSLATGLLFSGDRSLTGAEVSSAGTGVGLAFGRTSDCGRVSPGNGTNSSPGRGPPSTLLTSSTR